MHTDTNHLSFIYDRQIITANRNDRLILLIPHQHLSEHRTFGQDYGICQRVAGHIEDEHGGAAGGSSPLSTPGAADPFLSAAPARSAAVESVDSAYY